LFITFTLVGKGILFLLKYMKGLKKLKLLLNTQLGLIEIFLVFQINVNSEDIRFLFHCIIRVLFEQALPKIQAYSKYTITYTILIGPKNDKVSFILGLSL
jgi:hypothetical protein